MSDNKTTKLADTADQSVLVGNNRWYVYDFVQPVYLVKIEIESAGYERYDQFELEVFHTDDTIHKEKISVDNNFVSLSLGKLCRGFRFKPAQKFFSRTNIGLVRATGYSLDEFHSFEWEIKKIAERERRVTTAEEAVRAAEESRIVAKNEAQAIESEIVKLEVKKSELDNLVATLEQQVEKGETDKKDLQSQIKVLQEERRDLNASIAASEAKFSELTSKLRLFPSEIAGFVDQGNQNIRTYLIIGLPFAIILFIILWTLFSSAIDLTQIWRLEEEVDVWTIFLTRIPFVIVAFALIEACGFIVGRLVFEIIKINRQRLDFSKLSIIAKDVATASGLNTDMTAEQKFQEETRLKMGLLQEHMKSYQSEEFKYQGSTISSAIIGFAAKLLSPKS